MAISKRIEASARARLTQAADQIDNTLLRVAENNPLGAEQDTDRLVARLQAKAALTRDEATVMARGIEALTRTDAPKGGEERVYGSTIDFVSSVFLDRGAAACRAVARVAFRDGRAQGSGFLVSPRLFLTNHHVIGSAAAAASFCAEFDYELDRNDRQRDASRFAFDPAGFFETDERDDLDFTLIAIGERLSGPKRLSAFGWCPLSGAGDKHALGEVANIVQHPDGRLKEVVLRENRLVSRLDTVLHYVADTEPGSSGSPVFNNEWRVIALHHWGGPWRQTADDKGKPVPREVNEGIRISAIVKDLARRAPRMVAARRSLLDAAMQAGEAVEEPGLPPSAAAPDDAPMARLSADGTITWRLPIEISVRLPSLTPPAPMAAPPMAAPPVIAPDPAPAVERASKKPNPDYGGRPGYKPKFIAGHVIELPALSATLARGGADVGPQLTEAIVSFGGGGVVDVGGVGIHAIILLTCRATSASFPASPARATKRSSPHRSTASRRALTASLIARTGSAPGPTRAGNREPMLWAVCQVCPSRASLTTCSHARACRLSAAGSCPRSRCSWSQRFQPHDSMPASRRR